MRKKIFLILTLSFIFVFPSLEVKATCYYYKANCVNQCSIYGACPDPYQSGDYCYYNAGCCWCWESGACEPCDGYGWCTYQNRQVKPSDPCVDHCEGLDWYHNCKYECTADGWKCNCLITTCTASGCCDPTCDDTSGCGLSRNNSKCPSYCSGNIRYYNGSCKSDCTCSYSSENCDDYDGWYGTGNTTWVTCPDNQCQECEEREEVYRDYYCSEGSCTFTTGSTRWVFTGNRRNKPNCTSCSGNPYCSGNVRYYNFHCNNGSCVAQSSENCDNYDGCYSGYYRDYYCSGGSCTYTSSCTESCCDQYYGNSYAYCSGGTCYPPPSYTLTVSKSGSGSGTVTGPGINCGTDCSESYTAGTNVTLTATPASGSYFAGWSGDCSGTGSCTLTMNSNKSVTATFNISNQPPNASFSCNSSQCTGGSGDSSCIMYQPTSDIDPCIFKLVNNSSDPDGSISQTKWYIKKKTEPDSSYTEIGSCSGKCDHTIQITDVPDPAIYTVKLYVEDDKGASASITRDLTVKREISAGFMCSLDNSNWKPCETIKLFPGQTIFLKDDPSLTEHSVPSEGATINSWTWQRGDGANFETFALNTTNPTTTLSINQKVIRLIVKDTATRSDYQDHQLSVTYPLPFFREIPPIFFKIREFFASLISKFRFF